MPGTEVAIVAATDDDVSAVAGRRVRDAGAVREYRALAERASAGVWVARDASTPIAIAFAHRSDDELFIDELFVEPSFRGGGLGRALYARIAGAEEDADRSAVVDASDPAALGFALRCGLAAATPLMRFAGAIPREEQLARLAAGAYRFSTEPLDVGLHALALDALDRAVRGTARRDEHAAMRRVASAHVLRLDDEVAGYAYVWPDGRIGPLAAWSPSYLPPFLAFAMADLVRTYGASWCSALIPGPNVRAARAAIACGLRIAVSRTLVRSAASGDPARYVGGDERRF